MQLKLKDNPFGGLANAMIGLDWGCGVIVLALLVALFSGLVRQR